MAMPRTGGAPAAGGGAGASSGGAGDDASTAGTVATGGTGGMAGSTVPPGEGNCLDGITNYAEDGPFEYEATSSGQVKMWVPMVPPGCKVPMVHLANGTGATCGSYGPSLTRLASHGFLALCYENPNTGAGTQGLMAFQTALQEHPDLADYKFGSTGHSQGGQASFVVLQYAEKEWGDKGIYAGLAMEPASGFGAQPIEGWSQVYGMIKSPMFMFSGLGTDGLVSQLWVQSGFDALSDSVEAYFWAKAGATHIPVPNGEEQEISIPWFRWKLLGDPQACMAFKAIPMTNSAWTVVDSQNEADCN
jgi:hypothetical protein